VAGPTFKQLQASVGNGLSFETEFYPPLAIVASRIDVLGAMVTSFEEPLKESLTKVVLPSIKTNFSAGGRPTWQPLSEATMEIRQRFGQGGNKTLVRSGALRAAVTSMSSWLVTDTAASLNTFPENVWYGAIQQDGYGGMGGGQKVKGKTLSQIVASAGATGTTVAAIPARPFIMLQTEDEDKIVDIFMMWLGRKIEEAYP
jgi:phage gpG-like protein